jgi:hypothetical protein
MSHITSVELGLGHAARRGGDTYFRIPDLMLRSRGSSLDLLQDYRLRPGPARQLGRMAKVRAAHH